MVLDYIKKLLFEHNCVIIPSFGGIIANYGTASIHPVSNFLKPPVKRLAFNQSLQSNDGLLINTIAIHERITQEEATLQLTLFVKKIKNQLVQGEKIRLESIGTFEYNEEQRIQFVSDDSVNYLEDSFGLTELYFKPIDREEEDMKRIRPTQGRPVVRRAPIKNVAQGTTSNEENKEKNVEASEEAKTDDLVLTNDSNSTTNVSSETTNTPENPSKKQKDKEPKGEIEEKKKEAKSLLFLIIPIVLVVGAGGIYFFTQKDKTTDEEIQLVDSEDIETTENGEASVISTITETDNTSSFEEAEIVEENVTDNTLSFEQVETVTDNTTSLEETKEVIEEIHTTNHDVSVSEVAHGKVYVIAGAFTQKSKATRFASTFANGQILPHGDKYRVSIAEFSTKTEALEGLSSLKAEHGDNLWVLEY